MKFLLNILYFLYFSAGAGSLILEMVWTKIGTVLIGSTVSAAALVLSCYMSGLAAGAYFFGKQADVHPACLLRRLGLLQLGIAIGSLPGLSLFIAASAPWFRHVPSVLLSCIFCIAMLVPTMFMGGTFPVISKYLSTLRQDHVRTNRDIGGLYAINILGASTGALLGGFYLLESFGIITSALAASCLYAMIGCIFLFLQKTVQSNPAIAKPAALLIETDTLSTAATYVLPALSGLAGFALLSYEMLYSRVLSLFWNSTIYSFSIVVAIFLAGSGCGSAAAALFVSSGKKRPGPLKKPLFFYFCGTAVAAGISVIGSLVLWPDILSIADSMIRVSSSHATHAWLMTMSSKALASLMLIFIPSFFLGAQFIILVKTYSARAMTGKNIGIIYAANTIGGIAGAITAGFVFIPLIGAFKGLVITTILLFTAAGACITLCSSYFSRLQVLFLCALIAAGAGLTALSRSPYAPRPDEGMIYFKEGATATVKIIEAPDGTRRLFCNNREEGNTGLDPVRYARIEASLPLLLHPAPLQMLIIGIGTGISAGEACHYPATRSVRCVEISPEIARGAALFAQDNRQVFSNAKFRMTINDGRRFLRRTADRFDVIIMDLVNPGNTIGALYSSEFYELCRSHLKTGGIFCQWISLVQCTEPALQSVLATFAETFPAVSVWSVGSGRLVAVIGGDAAGGIDFSELQQRFTRNDSLRETLENTVCMSPFTLSSWFVMENRGISKYLQGRTRINTDNIPCFEYSVSKMVPRITPTAFDRFQNLLPFRNSVYDIFYNVPVQDTAVLNRYLTAREHLLRGGMLNEQGNEQQSFFEFQKALQINPRDEDAQYCLGISRLHERRVLERLKIRPDDVTACQELAYIYCQNRRFDDAAAFLEKFCATIRPEPAVYFTLARVYEEKGDTLKAIACYEKLRLFYPGNPEVDQRIRLLKADLKVGPFSMPSKDTHR